jgi:DNA-binding protein HU-beta
MRIDATPTILRILGGLGINRSQPHPNLLFVWAAQVAALYFDAAIRSERAMAAKKSAKSASQTTVTLKHLAAELAEGHELPKKHAEAMLGDLVASITKHLKKGERLRLVGLGILQVRRRAARMGRNPATGEAIKIKASKKVAFRASKDLKEAI